MTEIIYAIAGVLIAVISYFLKNTMNELKDVKKITYENKEKIALMENDYINKIDRLDDKFEILAKSIDKLTDKLDKIMNNFMN